MLTHIGAVMPAALALGVGRGSDTEFQAFQLGGGSIVIGLIQAVQ